MRTMHTVVFSAGDGGGNPCPVVLNADVLTTEQMQKMTADFGFESVYILKADTDDCDMHFRYFVPLHEMEMCVHATIAGTTVLVQEGIIEHSPVRIQTLLGTICVHWTKDGTSIRVGVDQFLPKTLPSAPSQEEICSALRISAAELVSKPIRSVATSRYKLIVPLAQVETLQHMEPDFEQLWALCDKYDTTGFYPFAEEYLENGTIIYHARQFPKRAGYNEDPATGVAASALGAYLAQEYPQRTQEGWNTFIIQQGEAMGRPSRIASQIEITNGEITGTRIIGYADRL